MAEINFDVPIDLDFLSEYGAISGNESESEMMGILREAAPLLEESMKKAISINVIHKDKSTGELINSITAHKPYKSKTDAYIVNVGPTGYSSNYYADRRGKKKVARRRRLSNAFKLIAMEYGLNGQYPRPVIRESLNMVENEVYRIVSQSLEKYWGG